MLDLRRLDILHRFATRGSITAVAADLGYSPSAVSQQLATLEREAGVALLERTAQSATLTEAGRELAEQGLAVLAAAEKAESRVRARAGTVTGHVTLSCIPGLAVTLAPHLADLQRRHDGLTLTVHETESPRGALDVLRRTSDVAVIDDWTQEPMTSPAGLVVHRLAREPVVLAIASSHPLAAQGGTVTVAGLRELLAEETWLSAPPGHPSREAGDARLAALGLTPVRRWEFDGLHVRARLAATEAGVTLLPRSIAEEQPGVSGLLLRPRMYRYVHLLTRATTSQDPAIASCLEAARRALS